MVQACGAKYCDRSDLLDDTDVDDVVVALVNCSKRVYSILIQHIFFYFCFLFVTFSILLSINFMAVDIYPLLFLSLTF